MSTIPSHTILCPHLSKIKARSRLHEYRARDRSRNTHTSHTLPPHMAANPLSGARLQVARGDGDLRRAPLTFRPSLGEHGAAGKCEQEDDLAKASVVRNPGGPCLTLSGGFGQPIGGWVWCPRVNSLCRHALLLIPGENSVERPERALRSHRLSTLGFCENGRRIIPDAPVGSGL